MIQDIAPNVYDNQFNSRRLPKKTDLLLIYKKNQVLVDAAERKQGHLMYPRVGSLPVLAEADGKISPRYREEAKNILEVRPGIYSFRGHRLLWLFKIDDIAFYGIDGDECLWADPEKYEWMPNTDYRATEHGYLSFAGITGVQLARWRQDHHFCGRCGSSMETSKTERAFVCPKCHATVYPKICPAVIVAITDGDRIVVTQYAGRGPSKNYALIAGFAEIGETIEETVHREVMEEVGLKVKNLRFYKSQPWSFSDTLLMGFYCELDGEDTISMDQDELQLAKFLNRDELPPRGSDISLTAEMMEEFRLGRQ